MVQEYVFLWQGRAHCGAGFRGEPWHEQRKSGSQRRALTPLRYEAISVVQVSRFKISPRGLGTKGFSSKNVSVCCLVSRNRITFLRQ